MHFVVVVRTAPLVYDTWAVDASSEEDAVHRALDQGYAPDAIVTILPDGVPEPAPPSS